MDIQRYKDISKKPKIVRYDVATHIPNLTDVDYSRGYINRYFVQQLNDKGSPIYEVTNKFYTYYRSVPQFTAVSLRWRVTGPNEQEYDKTGTIIDKSVSESNRIAIKLVAFEIPNLKLYLPNLLQFHKK
jgi:hypothetical protein